MNFRRKTVSVPVGGELRIGSDHPIVLQSMTTTDTMDVPGTVAQSIQMIDAGCELVRITAPTVAAAHSLGKIKDSLVKQGYATPLAADIHFKPDAAMEAAQFVEKVRINPGNFSMTFRIATGGGANSGADGFAVSIINAADVTDLTNIINLAGTGIDIDPAQRPELAGLAEHIARWSDRYVPPPEERDARLGRYPYLGAEQQFLEREPGAAPHLADIHDFTIATVMSLGPAGASINAMTTAVPRLVRALTRGLFREDIETHYESFLAYDVKMFDVEDIEWAGGNADAHIE